MKICWDNLEGMYLSKEENLKKPGRIYIEMTSCKKCGESYLTLKRSPSEYCDRSCGMQEKNNHFYGKKHSKKTILKLSEINMGENHPRWKGGISCEPYCDAWADKEYKESIKERDGYKCLNPDCFGNCNHLSLTIHHIDYNKKNCKPDNLITLCRSCNARANTNRKWHKSWYRIIMARRYGYPCKEVRYKACANFFN